MKWIQLAVVLLTVWGIMSCEKGTTRTPDHDMSDNDSMMNDTDQFSPDGDGEQSDETDDAEQPEETAETEQPDETIDDQTEDINPDEAVDTETPDMDHDSGTPSDMMDVPAGEFWMGCNEAVDTRCEYNEYPYHAVVLTDYKIDKYEVTVAQYQQCISSGACNWTENHYTTNTDISLCNLGATGKEHHPMNCVSWYGANAYCQWIGRRLPTEAEWEKAARGADGRKYPWGNTPTVSCDYAVMDDPNAGGYGCGTDGTMPVGSKPNGASPYGVYDMIGNVDEWVNDWHDDTYYASSPTNNPTGPETGTSGILRGGSWATRIMMMIHTSTLVYVCPTVVPVVGGELTRTGDLGSVARSELGGGDELRKTNRSTIIVRA